MKYLFILIVYQVNNDIKKTLDELIKKREQYYKKADLQIKNCQTINEAINELKNKFYINE